MKRFLLAMMAVMLFGWSTQAQLTHTSTGTVDENANSIIKKAAAKMTGSVSFTVTVVNYDSNKKETFRQKADILYQSPKYRVLAGSLEIYCDGKSVWQYNKNAKEVVVTNLIDSDDDLTNPARLLANYSKSYRAKFIREEEDGTAIVDLQPLKSHSYHKVRLFINAKTGVLKKLEQHNYDSSRGEFIVSNFKNAQANESDFVFDTKGHPGVEEVDMR